MVNVFVSFVDIYINKNAANVLLKFMNAALFIRPSSLVDLHKMRSL